MHYFLPILLLLSACLVNDTPIRTNHLEKSFVNEKSIVDVRVELVDGPALPMARLLSKSIASGLIKNGITASTKNNNVSRFVLKGRAEANWKDRRVPFVMLIYWTLFDNEGKAVGNYTQGVRGARWKWEFGDPLIIRAVGNGAAKPIAAMIIDDEREIFSRLLPGSGILIKPVTGAPGDGNNSLHEAMVKALRSADISITEDRRQASLVLTGQVSSQPFGKGQEKILLIGRVLTTDGFEVGRATQENNVPIGSLDGPWGDVVETIVGEALVGIERIIGSGNFGKSSSVKSMENKSILTPNLKQIPGRAPPPPK